MSDSVAKRAVAEAKEVSRLAVNAAKNELIDQMAPIMRDLIERRLRSGKLSEDVDRLRRAADGYGETEFEEGRDMGKKKDDDDMDEGVSALFPEIAEAEDCGMDEGGMPEYGATDEDAIPTLGEAEGDEMDEELEISEQELEAYYKEGLQLEVDVSKGFKDLPKSADVGDQDKSLSLSDEKSGEHNWEDEEPPAKKDWSVKEQAQVRALIRRGIAENKALRAENAKLRQAVGKAVPQLKEARQKLAEMNLFNAKILHVSKFLNRHKLTAEQKRTVVESLDKAPSVSEVKRTYAVLEAAMKASGVVSEGRRAKVDSGKRRTSGTPRQEVLRESVDRDGGGGFARALELAGLEGKVSGRR